ncbi:hypothetical protein E4U56_006910 [Claviceps arundinis]|uniref:Uncharacterized protein n=1 Tax=Claviceps arundinis TaxID=1623583 RepID=A0A9P7N2A5_9HYPO|nr:hypothetical protein E4U56_006910 [Claviceps arundinis]
MPPHSTFNLHQTKFSLRSCLLAHVKHVHGPFARRQTGGLTAAEMEEAEVIKPFATAYGDKFHG